MTNKSKHAGLGLALGAALGAVFGVLAGHMGIWLAIGVAIGMLLGASFRRKQNRLSAVRADPPRARTEAGKHERES